MNKETMACKVPLSAVVGSAEWREFKGEIPVVLGVGADGKGVVADLERLPHLLIAGYVASGVSEVLRGAVRSLLLCDDKLLKVALIDPKNVEFNEIDGDDPHLLRPVVTSEGALAELDTLDWMADEMARRLDSLHQAGARHFYQYNAQLPEGEERLTRLAVVVAHFEDLVRADRKRFERACARLAVYGRITGIHLILASWIPTPEVVLGSLLANIPARVSCPAKLKGIKETPRTLIACDAAESLSSGEFLYRDSFGKLLTAHCLK